MQSFGLSPAALPVRVRSTGCPVLLGSGVLEPGVLKAHGVSMSEKRAYGASCG